MKSTFKETVAYELKRLRINSKLNQKEVADKAGIDVMTLNRYENNACSMQLDIIEKILPIYDCDFYIFFNNVNANMHNKEKIKNNGVKEN